MRSAMPHVVGIGGRSRVAASLLAVVAFLSMPVEARGQFGAMAVVDAGAIAKLTTQISRQAQQLAVARQQLQRYVDNMKKLSNPNWRTVNSTLAQVDALIAQGQALAYSLATIDAEFRRTFPGTQITPTMPADMRVQRERTLATLRGALNAANVTAQQFATGAARLQAMKGQLASITSAQQAAELGGVIGIHTAEEITLLRQQLATVGAAQTVYLANEVNREAQGSAATTFFEATARTQGPTRTRRDIYALGF